MEDDIIIIDALGHLRRALTSFDDGLCDGLVVHHSDQARSALRDSQLPRGTIAAALGVLDALEGSLRHDAGAAACLALRRGRLAVALLGAGGPPPRG